MLYAVESKKRKFHRVLESISKPSTSDNVSKTSSSLTATPSTARDRLPANLSIKKVRLNSSENSDLASVRNSILKTPRSTNRTASASSTKRPTFAPWDRESFLERLETFRRVDRWTSKPSPINEVQWSKRGWICTDVMRVSCISGCGGSVVVKLPDEIDELDGFDAEKVQERKEVRAGLVEKYAKLLREGHGENCPWRNKGCDATIQHLPLANPETAVTRLHDRYLNLMKMGDKLPADDTIQTPDGFDLDGIINILPESWFQEPDTPREITTVCHENEINGNNREEGGQATERVPKSINRAALSISFFGWDAVADGAAGLVGCKACFRRLGLWMYKPKENGDVTVYTSLDVASEHMEYCPWVDRIAQAGTGSPDENMDNLRSGWELVAEAVKVKHRRRIRSGASTDTLRTEPSMHIGQGTFPDEPNEETRKTADREWWAKIRRVRQVLTAKSPRRKLNAPS
ncbi:uncharacterized protein N7459_001302 [Penicillium hispanicum]|uniref:uncharacterized protein n=1 Tax=Penicillium hispanicum TaxID=1080232 RepID=UPI00254032C6|nr:uncharacterized protein N7459_001302 [Penicillium hispanicum]KAJ5595094.1 hypothetical protein N7459_001302 [Penicillium hispanicum]